MTSCGVARATSRSPILLRYLALAKRRQAQPSALSASPAHNQANSAIVGVSGTARTGPNPRLQDRNCVDSPKIVEVVKVR
jgi:hypothetical protein